MPGQAPCLGCEAQPPFLGLFFFSETIIENEMEHLEARNLALKHGLNESPPLSIGTRKQVEII
jgi:hypothetical protein